MKFLRFAAIAIAISAVLAVPMLAFAGLSDVKKELKNQIKAGNWSEVASTIRKIGRYDSSAAVGAVIEAAKKCITNVECADAIKATLLSMESKEARSSICNRSKSAKPWQLKVIMAEAMGDIGGKQAVKALLAVAKDREGAVVRAAARALGQIGDKSAVEPLIDVLKKWDKEHSATFKNINQALQTITGKDLSEHHEWESWWSTAKNKFMDGEEEPSTGPRDTRIKGGGMRTTLFGIEIDSRRITFVIDRSGSMTTTEPELAKKWREKYGGKPKTAAQPEKDDSEEGRKKRREGQMRITLVKLELQRCIKSLGPDVKFTIIAYSTDFSVWKKTLQKASEGTKKTACKWVDAWVADGLTFTDEALREAFKIPEADTIILLSDGSPTHVGNTVPNVEPDDTPALCEAIYKEVAELNRFRKITIDTIGFETANKEFMAKLAKQNNGKFRPIE